jgi:hypothetical protein
MFKVKLKFLNMTLPLPHAAAALSIIIIYMQCTYLLFEQINSVKTPSFQTLNIPETETPHFRQDELV